MADWYTPGPDMFSQTDPRDAVMASIFDPAIRERGSLLPVGRNAQGGLSFAAPQFLVDMVRSALLPGAADKGYMATPEDATKAALDIGGMGSVLGKTPSGALASNTFRRSAPNPNREAAERFAAMVEGLGPQYGARIEEAAGGSVYVRPVEYRLKKDGTRVAVGQPSHLNFKARFADHGGYWGHGISVDPASGNTVDDVLNVFRYHVNPVGDAPRIKASKIDPETGQQYRGTAEYRRDLAMNRMNPLIEMGDWVPFGVGRRGTTIPNKGPAQSLPLPMDEASRMARATDQGYAIDAYRGMYPYDYKNGPVYGFKDGKWQQVENIGAVEPEITSMASPGKTELGGKYAGFFGDKETASRFAMYNNGGAVYPTKLKFDNPLVIDAQGKPAGAFQFEKMAKDAGTRDEWQQFNRVFMGDDSPYDGVIIKNTVDEGTLYIPKDGKQVRSRFAAFDPARSDSADLLAMNGPGGLAPGLWGGLQQDNEHDPLDQQIIRFLSGQ